MTKSNQHYGMNAQWESPWKVWGTWLTRTSCESTARVAESLGVLKNSCPPVVQESMAQWSKPLEGWCKWSMELSRAQFAKASEAGWIESSLLTWRRFNEALNRVEALVVSSPKHTEEPLEERLAQLQAEREQDRMI